MKPSLTTLFITWQEPESRRIYPIARLMGLAAGAYELAYIRAVLAAESNGFHGLPGFEDLEQVYVSTELPRLFEHRLPSGRRHAPRPASELDGGVDAAPITVLVPLPEGGSARLEVFAPPLPAGAGIYSGVFSVRGVGRIPGSEDVPLGLQPHEPLRLSAEPDNAYNSRALRVERADGTPIGYVPDYLANELSTVTARRARGADERVSATQARAAPSPADLLHVELSSAERINFPPAAPLYGVICRYSCGAEAGGQLFYSESYEPLSSRAQRRAPPRA